MKKRSQGATDGKQGAIVPWQHVCYSVHVRIRYSAGQIWAPFDNASFQTAVFQELLMESLRNAFDVCITSACCKMCPFFLFLLYRKLSGVNFTMVNIIGS